jgi:carbohydrate-selective porin OprB
MVNQFASYLGAGLVYTGLLPGRDGDVPGLGVSSVLKGDDFVDSVRFAGAHVDRCETVTELIYWAEVVPWLNVQPSV